MIKYKIEKIEFNFSIVMYIFIIEILGLNFFDMLIKFE